MLTIKRLIKEAHQNAKNKGFWEDWEEIEQTQIGNEETQRMLKNNAIGNRLMLIVSELGEAQEALRHNDMDNFKEELADVAIRLGDLCGGLNIDLEDEIRKKMERNKQRPYKHGKEF
ncbi:MazG nucleotide pyrophosphohydrolase domain-containing protein [Caloramator sp. Dgby_cultured_2]|uniref:MazG nucleotide pyrophosphohydrolase domain-containing protein n=1 Tax=Caloramator sp. Dgby_cultured_2 TaxID=3029174 RepID=UPI00237D45F6|nr:MazG nucleotide pyrophosphohydrolase domain-containing protein [Caloramator sp. Dgby_cultured_2]WDU84562.1 MazG nucleotide pyrophosphohydrolase domain-containing protein [Caloramator sp. Dgby_cultured_2]